MKWRLRQDESRGRKTREEARAIVRSSYQARSEVIWDFPFLGPLKPGVSESSGIFLSKTPAGSPWFGLTPKKKWSDVLCLWCWFISHSLYLLKKAHLHPHLSSQDWHRISKPSITPHMGILLDVDYCVCSIIESLNFCFFPLKNVEVRFVWVSN